MAVVIPNTKDEETFPDHLSSAILQRLNSSSEIIG